MEKNTQKHSTLLLEDGTVFKGFAIGKLGTSGGEICFNTGMTGYQEIYTDPSYSGQIIVNTTPHIGNYGARDIEKENTNPHIKGLVVNEFSNEYSRKVADESLQEFLEKNNTVGIQGLDTRMLVKHIREKGAMNALISSELSLEEMQEEIKKVPKMHSLELSSKVSTEKPYELGEGNEGVKIAVLDLGIKKSILDNFIERDCHLKVFPAKTSYSEMKAWNPDGYFLSNGPGDPSAMDYAIATTKEILAENHPLFGICLGHQLIAKAMGISTYKMHHGHRGLNHPVKNLVSGLSEVTSQNHGFAVNMEELEVSSEAELTHINLNDQTVQGLKLKNKPAFCVQYHPESSPGPNDSKYLFDDFINLINQHKK